MADPTEGSQARVFTRAHADAEGWELVDKTHGWPFEATRGPGDLLAAPQSALNACRARRLRAARIEFLPAGDDARRFARAEADRFMACETETAAAIPLGDEHGREVLVFIAEGVFGRTAPVLDAQLRFVETLVSRHPDTRVVWPRKDGRTLGSTAIRNLAERLETKRKEVVARVGNRVKDPARDSDTDGRPGTPAWKRGDSRDETAADTTPRPAPEPSDGCPPDEGPGF